MGNNEQGTLELIYYDPDKGKKTIDLGYIVDISTSMNKALSTIPLVSMGTDRAFQLETGSTLQYTISFKRKNPINPDDSSDDMTVWSNSKWYDALTEAIDRWQMKSDGYRLKYTPDDTNPYVPPIDVNGYIRMLSRTFSNDYNEIILGTMQFIVGTMHVLKSNITVYPTQVGYSYTTLDPNPDNNDDGKKFGLTEVYLVLSEEVPIAPYSPISWYSYSQYIDKTVTGWEIYVGSTKVGECSVGETNDKIEQGVILKAIWE